MEKNDQKSKVSNVSHWIPIGMCLGCSFGILLDNLALGIGLGLLFGASVGTLLDQLNKKKQSDDSPEENPQ